MQKQIPAPQHQPHPRPVGLQKKPRGRRRRQHSVSFLGIRLNRWTLAGGGVVLMLSTCAALTLVVALMIGAGRIPPGVRVMGSSLGMMTPPQAAAHIAELTSAVTLRDGQRTWTVATADLGIMVDAEATAARAAATGAAGLIGGGVRLEPSASINATTARDAFSSLRSQIETTPQNAGVRLVNGSVEAVPAQVGRALDVEATVLAVAVDVGATLASGEIDLVMQDVQPAVANAEPLVATARALLASPLRVQAYNPFEDETITWIAQPSQWGGWLIAEPDAASPIGLRLALSENNLANFLTEQADRTLTDYQYIETSEAVEAVSEALAKLSLAAQVRVYERDRMHTVRGGESITSIAYDYGIPYPYIEAANPSVGALTAGQTLTIPSREVFFEREPVVGKRIVVSISGNWTRVYEDDNLIWDWVSSTGINNSPTWPGVYQVLTHEENAYAGNWNLYMPWFLGVYKPIPGSDFTNGFHGFPTRGGGQILWENSLGTKVTYGCILLSNTNARLLYDWAEDGVIVEVLP